MAVSPQQNMHFYLVQPLNKSFREMIAYADNENDARRAAAAFDAELSSIYLNDGLSICIETEPDIIHVENDTVRIEYNSVLYDLQKNTAKEVIAEHFL